MLHYTEKQKLKIAKGLLNREETKWLFSEKYDNWMITQYKKLNNFKYNLQTRFFLDENWIRWNKIEDEIKKIEKELKEKSTKFEIMLGFKIDYNL